MRPTGTSHQLATRRERALVLVKQGHTLAQVAKVVGVTLRSVQRWLRDKLRPRNKREQNSRPPYRPCRLTPRQLKQLEQALLKGAGAHGYAEDYWTLSRIAHLIRRLFGIRYRRSAVWYLLRRMGWSCQKPQRRSFQHSDAEIAHWKRYLWPRIKKVA
jgi:transposase